MRFRCSGGILGRGISVVRGVDSLFIKECPCGRRHKQDLDTMQASEPGPAWPGFVKRSRQTHPRVGVRFGILRPFNVSSEAFNWTACLGAVEIFKLSAGAPTGATNAVPQCSDASVGGYIFDR